MIRLQFCDARVIVYLSPTGAKLPLNRIDNMSQKIARLSHLYDIAIDMQDFARADSIARMIAVLSLRWALATRGL